MHSRQQQQTQPASPAALKAKAHSRQQCCLLLPRVLPLLLLPRRRLLPVVLLLLRARCLKTPRCPVRLCRLAPRPQMLPYKQTPSARAAERPQGRALQRLGPSWLVLQGLTSPYSHHQQEQAQQQQQQQQERVLFCRLLPLLPSSRVMVVVLLQLQPARVAVAALLRPRLWCQHPPRQQQPQQQLV